MSEDGLGFQEYVCHKRVKAARITSVEFQGTPDAIRGGAITLDDSTLLDCPPEMFARYKPVEGDYLVEYEDGYRSISPAKPFEEGYALA